MHAAIARQRGRSPGAVASGPAMIRAPRRSSTAATARRTVPMSSGWAAARSTRTAVTEPVVPQEKAARAISRRPCSTSGHYSGGWGHAAAEHDRPEDARGAAARHAGGVPGRALRRGQPGARRGGVEHPRRSEEHTSELQSRLHLVCRLLLEKKKSAVRAALFL